MNETLVITYHSVDGSGSAISTSPAEFERHLAYLKRAGYSSFALLDAVRTLRTGNEIPTMSAIILFDDGYRNNLTHATPLLKKYGYAATVFVATGFCGGDNSWGDQHGSIPALEMMSRDDLRRIRDEGIELGAHTRTHPRLSRLSPSEAREEMEGSKTELEDILGADVRSFSYPYGDFSPLVRQIASELFETAIGNCPGRLSKNSDLYAVDRINACGRLFRTLPLNLAGLSSFGGYLAIKKIINQLSSKAT